MGLIPRGLEARLTLLVAGILLATGVTFAWVTARDQSEMLLASHRDDATVLARILGESSARYILLQDYAGLEAYLLKEAELPDILRLQVCEPDGLTLADVVRGPDARPRVRLKNGRLTPPTAAVPRITAEGGALDVWQPIEAGGTIGWVKATFSMAEISRVQEETWKSSILLALIWSGCSAVLILLTLRPTATAIGRITVFARNLDEHKGERLEVGHPAREIADLATSLNYASSRILSTEQALMRERERLRVTLRSIHDGVIAVSADGTLQLMNRSAEELTGWSSADAEGERLDEVVRLRLEQAPVSLASLLPGVTGSGAGLDLDAEAILLSKTGVARPVAGSIAPIVDDAGGVAGAVLALRDIGERKRAERKARQLAAIVESSDEAIIGKDLDGIVTSWNSGSEKIFGYSEEEMVGKSVSVLVPPERSEELRQILEKIRAGSSVERLETIRLRKDGRAVAVSVTVSAVRDATGRVVAASTIARDVTDFKRAEEALRESERRYKKLLDSVTDYIYTVRLEDGRPVGTVHGPGCAKVTGYAPEDYASDRELWLNMVYAADRAAVQDAAARLLAGEPVSPLEHRIHHRDGSLRWVRNTPVPRVDGQNRLVAYDGLITDITERKQAEGSLALMSFALDNVHEAAFLLDEEGRFQYVNEESCRQLGYARDELLGLRVSDVDPDFPADRWPAHWANLKTQRSLIFEGRHRTKDGRFLSVEVSANYLDYEGRSFNLALVRDITERKRTEDLLRKREAELKESQRLAHIGSWDWDAVHDLIWWSDEYYRIYGFDPGQPPPQYLSHLEVYTPESRRRLDAVVKRAMETGAPYELDLELARPTATTRWVVARGEAKRGADGRIWGLRGTAQNITERKRSEEALLEREATIRNILESVDEGFVVVDRGYRIRTANRAFCTLVKLPEAEVVGRFCHVLSHHLDQPCFETGGDCPVNYTFETGTSHSVTHTHTDSLGAKHSLEIKSYPVADASGHVVAAIQTVNDITDKRRLEEQLRQAQKMEAIGTLAGGVAHDFNNILTAIIGYGSIVKMRMRPDDPLHGPVDQILTSSDRAAHLTQGLLAFSRKQVINPKPVDLNDIVKSVEKLLRRLIGEDVELTTRLAGRSLIVMADTSQIEQVLMNLATNARDAMPQGGALTLTTAEIDIPEDAGGGPGNGKHGRHALISVSDTGTGMDEQTREKIFEPFFTTKELGKGTGLGLAIVYGIVKQHEGTISVSSEPGRGTTFRICLPLVVTAAEEDHGETTAPPRGGTETILLAEDDEPVRALITDILTDFGYRVVAAVDGRDALEKYAAHAGEIDLLLLDVVMPVMSGKEVFDAIKARRPDVAVLFASGYTADIIHKKGIFEEGLQFVSKPLSPFDLLRKVRAVLDGSQKNVCT